MTEVKKEQCRLMADVSHSGEESGDDGAALCNKYDEDEGGGLCRNIMRSKSGRLGAMLFLIIGYFFTELVVGHITNSLTLVADSFHMLSDALSLIVAMVAVRMSRRTAKDPFCPWPSKEPYFNTFGWVRFEILGALINSTFLLALCISIGLEAIEKFTEPKVVLKPQLVLAVGGGGLLINIAGLIMFGSHSHGHSHGHSHDHKAHDHSPSHGGQNGEAVVVSDDHSHDKKTPDLEQHLNMKAVFLHVLGDALGSVIVMISATVIWQVPHESNEDENGCPINSTMPLGTQNEWIRYIDPSMSLILVCIMIFTTVPLFKQSSMILLQTVPKHIKLEGIRNKLKKIPGIQAIHDLHIWQLSGEKIVATVHVQCANAETYLKLVQKIKESLHNEGIHSFTVQPEFSFSEDEQSPFCRLVCGEDCISKTCCPQDNPKSEKNRSPSGNGQQQASYVTSSDAAELVPTSSRSATAVLPNAIPSPTVVIENEEAGAGNGQELAPFSNVVRPRPRSMENPLHHQSTAPSTWSVPDASTSSTQQPPEFAAMVPDVYPAPSGAEDGNV